MRGLRLQLTSLLLAVFLVFPDVCGGVTLDVVAGEIAAGQTVGPEESSLTLRGSVNAADLDWIARNCRALQSLNLREVTVEPCRLDKGLATGLREFPGGVLPAYSLSGLTAPELVLPDGITEISDGALLGAGLTSLTVPASVSRIATGAFAGCEALREVKLGAGVESVGRSAFRGCRSLESVEADGGKLAGIGEKAFSGCENLKSFVFTSEAPALESIGDEAFSSSALQTLDLTACTRLRTVGRRAFASCLSLEELSLPSGVTAVGEGVLFGCTSLQNFRLPQSASELPDMALAGVSEMADASGLIHEGVTRIGSYSMAGMNLVTEFTLPASVREIGSGAFEGWSALGLLMAESLQEVPALGDGVWAGVNQPETELSVAEGMEAEFSSAPQWQEFAIRTPGESTLERLPVTDSGDGSLLEARLANSVLTVRTSEGIAGVALYDTDGRLLFSSAVKGECSLTVPTGLPAGKICIAAVRLVSDKVVGIKLINTSLQ